MKNLKLPKNRIIALGTITAILFVLGVVLLCLPDEVYYALGDGQPEVGRYVWFALFTFISVVALIRTLRFYSRCKKIIDKYNSLRSQLGDNAFFVAGFCSMYDCSNEAIKATISLLGGIVSATVFGIGFYTHYKTKKGRLFLICDEGIYVINVKTLADVFFSKEKIIGATLAENYKEHLEMTCLSHNLIFTFLTEKTEITNDVLRQRLQSTYACKIDTNEN